jgi:hypothetical protein
MLELCAFGANVSPEKTRAPSLALKSISLSNFEDIKRIREEED